MTIYQINGLTIGLLIFLFFQQFFACQPNCNICHGVFVITLFWHVPDKNSFKLLLRQSLHHFGIVFCYYFHQGVQSSIIRLINIDLTYLKQDASNLPFLFFVNFRQSMKIYYGNFKKCIKNLSSPPIQCWNPLTLIYACFANCSLTLLRGGREKKHKVVQIA